MSEDFEEELTGSDLMFDPKYVWPYGLGDIKSIEGEEVTNKHRMQAMNATECECLHYMDAAVREISPGCRRYGGTLMKIVTQFQEARSTIREEMTRIAHRNLRCVVAGNLRGRRVMNAGLAIEEKKARDNPPIPEPVEPAEPVDLVDGIDQNDEDFDPKLGFFKTD